MKKFIVSLFTILLACSVSGICTAESEELIQEQTLVAEQWVDDDHIMLEWLPAPGATRYCILIVDEEGQPSYMNCFTPDEALCPTDDDICLHVTATPRNPTDVFVYSILTPGSAAVSASSTQQRFEGVGGIDLSAPSWLQCKTNCTMESHQCHMNCGSTSGVPCRMKCLNAYRECLRHCVDW